MKFLLIILLGSCATLPDKRSEVASWTQKPLSQQINPFQSDGCSSFPEGTKDDRDTWLRCCIIHDIAYWQGGTENQKSTSDLELKKCVKAKNHEIIASLMHAGVTVGGTPRLKTDYRWGYGWNYTRGFLKISPIEKTYINKLKPKKGENLLKYLDKSAIDSRIKKLPKEIIY